MDIVDLKGSAVLTVREAMSQFESSSQLTTINPIPKPAEISGITFATVYKAHINIAYAGTNRSHVNSAEDELSQFVGRILADFPSDEVSEDMFHHQIFADVMLVGSCPNAVANAAYKIANFARQHAFLKLCD